MAYLIILILILIIVILFLVWKGFLGERTKADKPPLTPPISQGETGGERVEGICAVAMGKSKEKMENKQKILEFLKEKGGVNNTDIRELLGIADRTAVDYMDELEKEGKVKQVGETGRWAYYELK